MLPSRFFSKQLCFNYLCKYIYIYCMLTTILFKNLFFNYVLYLPNLYINIINIVTLKKKNIFKYFNLKFKRKKRMLALQFININITEDAFNFPKITFKNSQNFYIQNTYNAIESNLHTNVMPLYYNNFNCNNDSIFIYNFYLDFDEFFEENCNFKNNIQKFFIYLLVYKQKDLFYKSPAKIFPKKPKLKNTFMPDWNWSLPRLVQKLLRKKFFIFKTLKLHKKNNSSDVYKNKSNTLLKQKKISLNFKYKFNYIYKLIRRNFFLKSTLNNTAVKYFLKLKKRKIIDTLHNFFNITCILNFFFINLMHQKLLINANYIYLNGKNTINKNRKLNLFDIIQLPVSLTILNFFLYCAIFNKNLLKKLITKISHNRQFYKKKAMLINKSFYIENWVELDYLSMSCVILKIPKNFNFFKINSLNIFFYKTYSWKK